MEKFLEEYDNGGTNRERDRSVSPNVHSNENSLLLADTKRHRNDNCTSSSSGCANNHNQFSPDKLIKQQIDESAAIKTE